MKRIEWGGRILLLVIAAGILIIVGMYKLFTYKNGYTTVNAYVEGDAYNYILNAIYAAICFVASGFSLLIAAILGGIQTIYNRGLSKPENEDKKHEIKVEL